MGESKVDARLKILDSTVVDAHIRATQHENTLRGAVSRNDVTAQVEIDFVGEDSDSGARAGKVLGNPIRSRRRDDEWGGVDPGTAALSGRAATGSETKSVQAGIALSSAGSHG